VIKIITKIFTQEEVDEENEKYSGMWIGDTEFLSVKKLEQWLPWKVNTIQRKIRTGKLRGRKIDRQWFVTRDDLYRFFGATENMISERFKE